MFSSKRFIAIRARLNLAPIFSISHRNASNESSAMMTHLHRLLHEKNCHTVHLIVSELRIVLLPELSPSDSRKNVASRWSTLAAGTTTITTNEMSLRWTTSPENLFRLDGGQFRFTPISKRLLVHESLIRMDAAGKKFHDFCVIRRIRTRPLCCWASKDDDDDPRPVCCCASHLCVHWPLACRWSNIAVRFDTQCAEADGLH